MLRLGILGLGMVAAMVVFDCGGRTPLQDEELFGDPSVAAGGANTILPGSGGSTVGTGGSGTGIAGSNSVGGGGGSSFGGSPGFGGTGFGTGGGVITGTGGSTGIGGFGTAGSVGIGGSVGTGGTSTGTAGFNGTGGAGGGPDQVRRLISELPGTRPNPACVGCATMCPGSAQCSANPICVAGLACAIANCGMQNGNPGLACLGKCVGGDPQALAQALGAIGCVYATCGTSCIAGRMR